MTRHQRGVVNDIRFRRLNWFIDSHRHLQRSASGQRSSHLVCTSEKDCRRLNGDKGCAILAGLWGGRLVHTWGGTTGVVVVVIIIELLLCCCRRRPSWKDSQRGESTFVVRVQSETS